MSWGDRMVQVIRKGTRDDKEKVISFLRKGSMDGEEIDIPVENFIFIEDEKGNVQGTLGLSIHKPFALLRYFVISPQVTEISLLQMFEYVFLTAKGQNIQTIYLALQQKSFQRFFTWLGFQICKSIPPFLQENKSSKPLFFVDNSVFMEKNLK